MRTARTIAALTTVALDSAKVAGNPEFNLPRRVVDGRSADVHFEFGGWGSDAGIEQPAAEDIAPYEASVTAFRPADRPATRNACRLG